MSVNPTTPLPSGSTKTTSRPLKTGPGREFAAALPALCFRFEAALVIEVDPFVYLVLGDTVLIGKWGVKVLLSSVARY